MHVRRERKQPSYLPYCPRIRASRYSPHRALLSTAIEQKAERGHDPLDHVQDGLGDRAV
jgi:hypothetical protein